MTDEEMESRLAKTPLPAPPPELRGRIVAAGQRLVRRRRLERIWRWTLGVAAVVLVAINLYFARVQERQMVALVGPAAIERPLYTKALAQQLERRQRLLTLATGDFERYLKEGSL